MRCPACSPAQTLELDVLEGGTLKARQCPNCGGHWIRTADYWRWRALHGGNLPETPKPEITPASAKESAGLRHCPDCDYVLARYRVGRGVPFSVDHCRNCEGAWLDGGEWEVLRSRNLHDDLPMMFDDAWQRSARREDAERATETSFKRRLGDEDYQRAQGIRRWLDEHPRRSEIFAYLQLRERGE